MRVLGSSCFSDKMILKPVEGWFGNRFIIYRYRFLNLRNCTAYDCLARNILSNGHPVYSRSWTGYDWLVLKSVFLRNYTRYDSLARKIPSNGYQVNLRWVKFKFFRDSEARATIACQTSVALERLNHFGIRSDSFKLRSNTCLSLGPIKYEKKVVDDKQAAKELYACFLTRKTRCHVSARLN